MNCNSRNLNCTYPDHGFQHSYWSDQYQSAVDKSKENPTQIALPPETHWTTRMKELELMHQWSLKTCHGFSPAMSTIFSRLRCVPWNASWVSDGLIACIDMSTLCHWKNGAGSPFFYNNRWCLSLSRKSPTCLSDWAQTNITIELRGTLAMLYDHDGFRSCFPIQKATKPRWRFERFSIKFDINVFLWKGHSLRHW